MRTFVTGGSGFLGREMIRALVERGHTVRAIARSPKSEAAVRAAGAEPVKGDLDDVPSMQTGMEGCDWVIHCAANTEEWDSDESFWRVNVVGTDNAMAAARGARVRRFVLISSEAVLADGNPIIDADETAPLPASPLPGYPLTKGECERRVRAASNADFQTVVVRPRYIWGRNDTAVLSKIIEGIRGGRFKWVGGGRYPTTTTHVANACEGAILAAEKGTPGEVYFVTDGPPVEFREWVTKLLATQQRPAPEGSVPFGLAWAAAVAAEGVWRLMGRKTTPPATKVSIGLMGQQVTVKDDKARRELGYVGRVSREQGLAEMARLPPIVPL
ncbi:MAG: NAD-dependent epimerase/dehydratase family protein [Myxococcaceae bacterium]|nr:NAD-dependent epimerase/dehydratase family protein [Myxococcaceae bacterium]